MLRYQWVDKTCQAIRCISNAIGPFRKPAQGVACPLDSSREIALSHGAIGAAADRALWILRKVASLRAGIGESFSLGEYLRVPYGGLNHT